MAQQEVVAVISTQSLLDTLTADVGVGGDLLDPRLVLFTNAAASVNPNDNVPADLTAPTFGSYAVVNPAAWGTPYVNPQGGAEVLGPQTTYVSSNNNAGDPVTGCALLNTAGTAILALMFFAVAKDMTQLNAGFTLTPRWTRRSA